MSLTEREAISIESRPLSDVSGSIIQRLDKPALRRLGVVDDDGDLVDDDLDARQTIYRDGRVVIDIPLDEIDDGE